MARMEIKHTGGTLDDNDLLLARFRSTRRRRIRAKDHQRQCDGARSSGLFQ